MLALPVIGKGKQWINYKHFFSLCAVKIGTLSIYKKKLEELFRELAEKSLEVLLERFLNEFLKVF